MFDSLTRTFGGMFRKLSGTDKISEKNVADSMADVRNALLDADVNREVVDRFCDDVMQDALGRKVASSLNPGQEMIGIVNRRLIELLGGTAEVPAEGADPLEALIPKFSPKGEASDALIMRVSPGPTVIMMCGLQGSGKTTTTGKIAAYLKKRGRSVMVAAADLQRPAAVEQLETVGRQVQNDMAGGATVYVYSEPDKVSAYGKAVGVAVDVCRRALEAARKAGVDTLILDTAGRLHVNDELMGELKQIRQFVQPHHIFLVVDAMSGQDAMRSSRAFHEALSVDGLILTKFDSDTRGGAALSARHVTGAPIKFVGVGEKLEALEEFHPNRMAGRMLGMGDVVALVEKAHQEVDEDEAASLSEKMARGEMGMGDFLKQLKTLRRMGPLKQIMGLLPGVGSMFKDLHIEEKQLDRVEAMIGSMTKRERDEPKIINTQRRKRIAKGAGVDVEAVSQLVKQFDMVCKMSQMMANVSPSDRVKAVKEMGGRGMAGMIPGMEGMPSMGAKGSSFSTSIKDRFKKRKK